MHLIISSSKRFNLLVKNNTYLKKNFILITNKKYVNFQYLKKKKFTKIFVPYWNYKIPEKICKNFNLYGFHSTPLPFGRGGSPIQNMIIRGYNNSSLCAFKLEKDFDSGKIYLKKKFSLKGSGQEILQKLDNLLVDMIIQLVKKNIKPKPQKGKPTFFKRRSGIDNILPTNKNLITLFNHIRMLDIKDHPNSNITLNNTKINFFDAKKYKNFIEAKVKIEKIKK